MRYVRKAHETPVAEPVPAAPVTPVPASVDASELVGAIQALHAAAERIRSPAVNVTVPESKATKPTAFTVKVTKRDHKGRAEEFDVFVKGEAKPVNDLEAGFNEGTLQ